MQSISSMTTVNRGSKLAMYLVPELINERDVNGRVTDGISHELLAAWSLNSRVGPPKPLDLVSCDIQRYQRIYGQSLSGYLQYSYLTHDSASIVVRMIPVQLDIQGLYEMQGHGKKMNVTDKSTPPHVHSVSMGERHCGNESNS
jgi:hypothetical protein